MNLRVMGAPGAFLRRRMDGATATCRNGCLASHPRPPLFRAPLATAVARPARERGRVRRRPRFIDVTSGHCPDKSCAALFTSLFAAFCSGISWSTLYATSDRMLSLRSPYGQGVLFYMASGSASCAITRWKLPGLHDELDLHRLKSASEVVESASLLTAP